LRVLPPPPRPEPEPHQQQQQQPQLNPVYDEINEGQYEQPISLNPNYVSLNRNYQSLNANRKSYGDINNLDDEELDTSGYELAIDSIQSASNPVVKEYSELSGFHDEYDVDI
jgi:hypothetical protein